MTSQELCALEQHRNYRGQQKFSTAIAKQRLRQKLIEAAPRGTRNIANYCTRAESQLLAGGIEECRFENIHHARRELGYVSAQKLKIALWRLKDAWAGLVRVSAWHDQNNYAVRFQALYPPPADSSAPAAEKNQWQL